MVRDALAALKITSYAEDHRIARHSRVCANRARPFAKAGVDICQSSSPRSLRAAIQKLITAEYRIAKRPAGHVLVDYNQNAWNRTLASVYSVRPETRRHRIRRPSPGTKSNAACASKISRCRTVPARVAKPWRPVEAAACGTRPRAIWKHFCDSPAED